MFFPVRLALSATLFLSTSNIGYAGPTPQTPIQQIPAAPKLPIQIEAVTPGKELRLNVEINHGDVVASLSEIAMKGNLQLAIKPGIADEVDTLSLKEATPEAALQKVCELAGVSYELKDGTWLVSPTQTTAPTPKIKFMDSMTFTNVDMTALLSILAGQFDLPIAITPDVKGKIPFIRLQNKTPRQALDVISLAANLQIEKADDGTFIVSLKQP